MKTAYLSPEDDWSTRVVVWEGSVRREYYAGSYAGAMRIVDERHANAGMPQFYDRNGNRLVDAGWYFVPIEEEST